MIYVYAVTDPLPRPPADVLGINDRPTEALATENGITVIISCHTDHTISTAPVQLYRHEHVVDSLQRDRAVLPARFGTTFTDERHLRTAIGPKAPLLRTGLDHVRGCVEFGIRVLSCDNPSPTTPVLQPAAAPTPPESGRAWMLARLAREKQARLNAESDQALAATLHTPLANLSRDSRLHLRPSTRFLLTAAYLVPTVRADDFASVARSLASDHPRLRLLCTGPWPPYNFTPDFAGQEAPRA